MRSEQFVFRRAGPDAVLLKTHLPKCPCCGMSAEEIGNRIHYCDEAYIEKINKTFNLKPKE